MVDCLPGTQIEADFSDPRNLKIIFTGIFASGGLLLSQVSAMSGIELHTIQNWVKRGYCSSPVNKKYTERQFCRLIIINMLKDVMHINDATTLLSKINGHLDDESDDMISDADLYAYFVYSICELFQSGGIPSETEIKAAVKNAVKEYKEPFAGGAKRLEKVLRIMVYAYFSKEFQKKALLGLSEIE